MNVRWVAWSLGTLLLFPLLGESSPGQDVGGPRPAQSNAIRERMADIVARDAATPRVPKLRAPRPRRTLHPLFWRAGSTEKSPATRSAVPVPEAGVTILPKSPQTVGTSFLGTDIQDDDSSGYVYPLDAMGAAGPTQILLISNLVLKVFDKATGTPTSGVPEVFVDTFFGSVIKAGTSSTDVRARYDRLSGRWFVAALDGDTSTPGGGFGNHFMLAVSDGSTISSSTVWSFFSFVAGLGNLQADSDTIGIDVNAIYVGASLFGSSFQGCAAYVIQKSSVLGAGPIHVTSFPGICSAAAVGTYLPQGCDNDDPAPTYGYLVGVDVSSLYGAQTQLSTNLRLIRIANPGSASPTIDQTFNIAVPAYGFPVGTDLGLLANSVSPFGVPVKGCVTPPPKGNPDPPTAVVGLDDLDPRLTAATIRAGNLWTVHNIDVDSGGAAIGYNPSTGVPLSSAGRDGARWYEITGLSATPTLSQSGTLFDSTPGTAASSHFVPTLTVTGQGHMALASSRGGPNEYANVAAAGRLAGDPAGSTRAGTLLVSSTTPYNLDVQNPFQRWGDYTCTTVDPNDNMTVWTFQEYCDGTFVDTSPTGTPSTVLSSQAVRVIQLLAPPPSVATSASPSSLGTGITSILVSLDAPSVSGSGLYDPGVGFPNHLTATVSGGVTVNSVSYIDSAHVTLDLNTTGATPGTHASVTLINPDGQSVTASNLLSITAPGSSAATVTQLTSSLPNGTYGTGATIPIRVAFSEAVQVSGTPTLALSSGGTATYASGSGSATLLFNYVVSAGDGTAGAALDAASTQALVLGGGTISTGGTAANLTLPIGNTTSPPWSLSSQKSIIINTTPPVTAIVSTPPNPSNDTTPVFTYSASQSGCTFQVKIDGGGWGAPSAATTVTIGPPAFSALAAGSHTFMVRATDALGNVDLAPPSYTWTIDLTPPVTTLLTMPPNPSTSASATFTFSANKAGCTFQTRLDGGAWTPVGTSTSATLGPLSSGSHTAMVRATDPAGNTDPAPPSYTWVVNLPATPSLGSGHGGGGGGCGALGWEAILVAGLLRARRSRATSKRR